MGKLRTQESPFLSRGIEYLGGLSRSQPPKARSSTGHLKIRQELFFPLPTHLNRHPVSGETGRPAAFAFPVCYLLETVLAEPG